MMVSELAETCRFINTNKLVVFDVPHPLLIVTYTTGVPELRTTTFIQPPFQFLLIPKLLLSTKPSNFFRPGTVQHTVYSSSLPHLYFISR